jgi:hypothetical protein
MAEGPTAHCVSSNGQCTPAATRSRQTPKCGARYRLGLIVTQPAVDRTVVRQTPLSSGLYPGSVPRRAVSIVAPPQLRQRIVPRSQKHVSDGDVPARSRCRDVPRHALNCAKGKAVHQRRTASNARRRSPPPHTDGARYPSRRFVRLPVKHPRRRHDARHAGGSAPRRRPAPA